MKHIIITKQQADLIRGRYGLYSEIQPIRTPDGMFIIPERCLTDTDLQDALKKLQQIEKEAISQEIKEITKVESVEKDKYYTSDFGLIKCIESCNIVKDQPIDEKKFIISDSTKLELESVKK